MQSAFNRMCFGKDFVLDGKIRIQVDLSSFDRFMPEPNRDHGAIDAGLQQLHGCGVSKNMRTNVFISERRTYLLRSLSVFGHEMLNRVGTESSASRTREQETRCHPFLGI